MSRSVGLVRSLVSFVALSLLAGSVRAETGPASDPARQAPPAGASTAPRARRIGLMVGGLVTFAVPYTLGVLAAFSSARATNEMCPCPTTNGPGDLLIPVAGPWIALATSRKDAALFSLLGIAQATGVAITIGCIVRYVNDGLPAEDSRRAGGEGQRGSRPGGFVSFGLLPTRDGAFGFLSGRM